MPNKTEVCLRTLIVGQGMRPAVNQGKKGIETGTNHNDDRIAKMANLWQYCILFWLLDDRARLQSHASYQQLKTNN